MLFNKLFVFWFLIFCLLQQNSYGQIEKNADSLIVQQFEEAERSVFLLQNGKSLIPIQRLDTLNIESINVGADSINTFDEVLAKYTVLNFQTFDLEKDTFLKDEKTKAELTILHFHLDELFELNAEVIAELQELIAQTNTISVVFDERGILNSFPFHFEKVTHLIYVSGAGSFHQSLAAQLIFGGFGAKNYLQKDLNQHFKKGEGLSSERGLRLRYSPPQLLGMNAQILHDSITSISQNAIDSNAFPGCQVLVVKNGHVVFHETWGYQTYDKKNAVQQSDIYDFASVTKITGALPALMKLQGEGSFDLINHRNIIIL